MCFLTMAITVQSNCYICVGGMLETFDSADAGYGHFKQELKNWLIVADGGSVGPT